MAPTTRLGQVSGAMVLTNTGWFSWSGSALMSGCLELRQGAQKGGRAQMRGRCA